MGRGWGRFSGARRERRSSSPLGVTRSGAYSRREPARPWIPGLDDVSREGCFSTPACRRELPERHPGPRPGAARGAQPLVARPFGRRRLSADGEAAPLRGREQCEADSEEVFTTYLRPTDGSDAIGWGKAGRWRFRPTGSGRSSSARRSPPGSAPDRRGRAAVPSGGGCLYWRAAFFPDGRGSCSTADDEKGNAARYIQDVGRRSPRPSAPRGLGTFVSPDGRLVAGGRARRTTIYPADGSGPPRPVLALTRDDSFIRWSADGRTIYLRAGRRAADPLSPRSRDGTPRALEAARASGHDGIPVLRAAHQGSGAQHHARRSVLRLYLLDRLEPARPRGRRPNWWK